MQRAELVSVLGYHPCGLAVLRGDKNSDLIAEIVRPGDARVVAQGGSVPELMKYYLLTYNPEHIFVPELLWKRINERRRLGSRAWRNAGGERLSDTTPASSLWGMRPGFLLVDAGLKPGWIEQFGDAGVRDTTHGDRAMFTLVMDAVTSDVYTQPGPWQRHDYYRCMIWPVELGGRRRQQDSTTSVSYDLADPVVRRWDGNSLDQLYSQEAIEWLAAQGASGVTFSLVWDPDRLMPIGHRHEHETVEL